MGMRSERETGDDGNGNTVADCGPAAVAAKCSPALLLLVLCSALRPSTHTPSNSPAAIHSRDGSEHAGSFLLRNLLS